jgi:lipid A 3-O-deacylase
MRRLVLAFSTAIAPHLFSVPALADEAYSYTFQWENDMGSTDRWYTNGLRFEKNFLQKQGTKHERFLSFLTDSWCKTECDIRGQAVGQNFYTPQNITIAANQPDDRPWAGWLYYGISAQKISDDQTFQETLDMNIGVVGPLAGGKLVQKKWHELIDSKEPRGWDNQLRNEPGILVNRINRHRYGTERADFVLHYGGSVGNVATAAAVGGTFRFGFGISGFGVPNVRGTALLSGHVPADIDAKDRPRRRPPDRLALAQLYGFLYAETRLVVQNIFLDGNTFRDSHGVDKKHLVADYGFGISAMLNNNRRVSFLRLNRTPEFTTPSGAEPVQKFTSFVFTQEFD